ncbi:MAG: cation:proton antiporter, partial [Pseudomonas sp.]|nr:cation:proton antiporter [Pseudomonas sp.]
AIVSKELTSLGEIFSSHGQNAIGVLLFQDVVAVLLLTLVPVFAGSSDQTWYWVLPVTLGKTVVLFVGLLLASRWLLPRLFYEVAASHSAELFVLLALVIVLLTAWLTHLFGLSPALGAFLAGMLLGESHYRHQIEADIRPFRDILLGLFFVSIGMLIDLQLFANHAVLILGLTLALLLIKGLVVAALVKWRGSDGETAWRSGLALAQGGEFCFALMAQMQQSKLMPADIGGLLLAATFCSMLLTPLLLRAAPGIAARLHRKPNEEAKLEEITELNAELHRHVVICGYGRVGQSIGRFLRREQQRFIALDDDPVRVQEAAAGESCVHYGDSRRGDLLVAVGLERARLLVIAVDKTDIALIVLKEARRINGEVPILVRTRDDSQLAELKAAGANEVVPELLESSLMLASHALIMLGLPEQQVQTKVNEVRHNRYRLLHGFYHGAQSNLLDNRGQPKVLMHAVNLGADAYACGQSLSQLALEQLGVDIQAVQRGGNELTLEGATHLHAGDKVLMSGTLSAVEACEARLLGG